MCVCVCVARKQEKSFLPEHLEFVTAGKKSPFKKKPKTILGQLLDEALGGEAGGGGSNDNEREVQSKKRELATSRPASDFPVC